MSTETPTRLAALLARLAEAEPGQWPQHRLAAEIGVAQATVSRLVSGVQAESRPLSLVLDAFAQARGWPDLTAARFVVAREVVP